MASGSIYDRFHLLPTPPPTSLSRSDSSVRMRLPDLQTVEDARIFVDRLVIYKHNKATNVVSTVFGCIVIVLLLTTLIKKIPHYVHRRMWLLRFVKTPRGTVILPCVNAAASWFIALFLLLNGTCAFVQASASSRQHPVPVQDLPGWFLLQFLPLWTALLVQTWSIAYARVPGSKHYQLSFHPRSARAELSPMVINVIWILAPFVACTIIGVPAGLSGPSFQRMITMRKEWMARFGTADELSDDLLKGIQEIWNEGRNAAYFFAIGMILWSLLATSIGVLHGFLAVKLSRKLQQHLAVLLHLKQSRKAAATLCIEHTTIVTVAQADSLSSEYPSPAHPANIPKLEAANDEHAQVTYLFPSVAARTARHEDLADGSAFRSVLRFFRCQTVVFVLAVIGYGIVALMVGLSIVDAFETAEMEYLERWAFLSSQVLAVLLGVIIIILATFLDRSDAFLALMHGDYQAQKGTINGVASARKSTSTESTLELSSSTRTIFGDATFFSTAAHADSKVF
ncbi:hypothetical protein OC842_002272 [Tilletia horrida]|uniref:Uncharacterized protein n=1 Tax=Tilletia horrida TaxID=155126 RepID=A0AAN6GG58_9BASI|nr:hypothetical protein OC842_002272 [Tilletia horrida]